MTHYTRQYSQNEERNPRARVFPSAASPTKQAD